MVSVVLITRHQASATALINTIQASKSLDKVIFESWHVRPPEDEEAGGFPRAVTDLVGRFKYYERRLREQLEGRRQLELEGLDRVFGDRWRASFAPPPAEEIAAGAWSKASEILERDPPDVILVFGTSLIPESVTSKARIAALNIHSGLSPYYRGQNCTGFAIINDDLDNIGVTVHLVRKAIDGGEIIVQARPEIALGDNEFTIELKLHRLGAELYVELLRRIEAGETLAPLAQAKDCGLLLMNSAYTDSHGRLVRELVAGGAIRRFLDRKTKGKLREKPIVDTLRPR